MAVLMPKTQQAMTSDQQNVVTALSSAPSGLRREEIANFVASPVSSAAQVDAAIQQLIAGGAAQGPDEAGRYRLTPAGKQAEQFGELGFSGDDDEEQA